jgi:hypothetical protein
MSPRVRVVFGAVLVCLVAWLAALVFAPQVVPSFLVPSHFKILGAGGGDDQPPIIVSDGSVMLLTTGTWTADAKNTRYVNDSGNLNDNSAKSIAFIVSGATDAGGSACPYGVHKTRDIELDTSASTAYQLAVIDIASDAYFGKLGVSYGPSAPGTLSNSNNQVDLGQIPISMVQASLIDDPIDKLVCHAPPVTATDQHPSFHVLVFPHHHS